MPVISLTSIKEKRSIGVFRRELIASVELRFEPILAMMALEGAANCEALAARYAEQANMGNDTTPVTLDAMFATIARGTIHNSQVLLQNS